MNFSSNCTVDDVRSSGLGTASFQDTMAPLLWTSWLTSLVLGNSLLGAIIHFEWFGGDQQKRGLQNRLVSEMLIATILGINCFHLYFPAKEFDIIGPVVLETLIKIRRGFQFVAITLMIFHSLTGTVGGQIYGPVDRLLGQSLNFTSWCWFSECLKESLIALIYLSL